MDSKPDTPSPTLEKEHAARVKDGGRESRLSFRNLAEHTLRREMREVAMEICKPQIGEFAKCSEEKGLMVVISCRKFFQGINDCMATHNSEEAWQKYKVEHEAEIEKKSKVGGLSKSSDPRPMSR